MNIKLPKRFLYYGDGMHSHAFVSDGTLYLRGMIDYESLMYTLSYVTNGYERCYYCGKPLTPEDRTMDHMYSRAFGGVSLPNNLCAACQTCNGLKADMSIEQFYEWREISNERDRKAFYKKVRRSNVEILKNGGFVLPKRWLTKYDIQDIRDENLFKDIIREGKVFKKLYERHGIFPRPIVITSNGAVIEGMHSVFLAYKHNVDKVPAIVLDNVQKIDFP